ncbi:CHASE3 domain-containing protein [Kitasatospora sp. NPDC085895]|uniref:CHASE3 domain-containing protein n=1 Tax=Kitasatospora sp. NPDC085895 TaxID=3155057 RepID=UPI00344B8011
MTGPAVVEGTAPLPEPAGRDSAARLPGLQDAGERLAALRRAADTPPGRLRLAGAALVALVLLFGGTAAWQADRRAGATDRVVGHSQPLSRDAAEIYRSLADADTTAAGGFLLAGDEPAELRKRYEDDLATAGELLTRAAARTAANSEAQHRIDDLSRQLPQYAGLVETARADNRLGLPLGGAYLRYASGLMQNTMLPSAQQLVTAESGQLDEDFDAAGAMPVAALLLGLAALAALGGYQVLLFRRTNRVFNPGLVTASAAVLAAVLWLAVGGAVASASLAAGRTGGAEPLRVLGQARTEALQARAAENLNLVARGASDSYGKRWQTVTGSLGGAPTPSGGRAGGGTLDRAAALAPAGEAEHRLDEARKQFAQWDSRHDAAAASDRAGDYEAALRATVAVASDTTTEAAWAAMDRQLAAAGAAEQDRFGAKTSGVAGGYEALAAGAAVLAVLAAAGVVRGIGRRLAEYR